MTEINMWEPLELYNVLNQSRGVSRLAEENYLCLIDAREKEDFCTSHIITAINMRLDFDGSFLLPEWVEVDTMRHIVVYDSKTGTLQEKGHAIDCAEVLATPSLYPVHVLKGGFQAFSALYPFLRTEKILYTIMELENLKIYPVEVLAKCLYMGDQKQSQDVSILKDLKIAAVVSIADAAENDSSESTGDKPTVLNVSMADEVESDFLSEFQNICGFIDSNVKAGSRVLIVSRLGRSRCSTVAIAFVMHHRKWTLEEAWCHLLKCKPTMRPNTGFIEQLSDWESQTMGRKHTDISKEIF